jgi:hypothetical protein
MRVKPAHFGGSGLGMVVRSGGVPGVPVDRGLYESFLDAHRAEVAQHGGSTCGLS